MSDGAPPKRRRSSGRWASSGPATIFCLAGVFAVGTACPPVISPFFRQDTGPNLKEREQTAPPGSCPRFGRKGVRVVRPADKVEVPAMRGSERELTIKGVVEQNEK